MRLAIMKKYDFLFPAWLKPRIKEFYRSLEYYKNNLFTKGDERFRHVNVEISTDCNRVCKICPRSKYPKPKASMDDKLYDLLLEQLKAINFSGSIAPHFYNEPFLDARLPAIARKTKSMLPKSEFIVFTNGSLVNKENLKLLIDSGVDGFVISQYSGNLPRDSIDHLFSQLPKEIMKRIRHRILYDDTLLSTRGNLVNIKNPIRKKSCFQASNGAMIDHKGNVILCCEDYHTEYMFGNIKDKPIEKIWNSPAYKKIRKDLRKGKFNLDICKSCAGKNL